ncbi:MAG: hypothetical protein GYA24_10115 [Candidatus Lokiarchaeota archaeon]|nr:hypothetical protein [Candidatus Lokiarchaeota archaeon]
MTVPSQPGCPLRGMHLSNKADHIPLRLDKAKALGSMARNAGSAWMSGEQVARVRGAMGMFQFERFK